MAWVATAVVGGSVIGGVLQGNAAKDAANSQIGAANSANQIQLDMYNQNRKDQEAYRQAGYSALNTLFGRDQNYQKRQDLQAKIDEANNGATHLQGLITGKTGLGGDDARWAPGLATYQSDAAKYKAELDALGPESPQLSQAQIGQGIMSQDPGYQFRLDQGNKQINAGAAARGMANSGRTMKELTRYGSDFASNEYGNAYNRLASMAGMGQTAVNQMGQYGQTYGQQAGQNYGSIGNAQAAGSIGQANAVSSGIGNITNGLMNYNFLNKYKGG